VISQQIDIKQKGYARVKRNFETCYSKQIIKTDHKHAKQ